MKGEVDFLSLQALKAHRRPVINPTADERRLWRGDPPPPIFMELEAGEAAGASRCASCCGDTPSRAGR